MSPPHPLDAFFRPRAIAVHGADERPGALGRAVLWNLLSSPFGGIVHPVNPAFSHVLGVHCHASFGDLPGGPVDLAIFTSAGEPALAGLEQALETGVSACLLMPENLRLPPQLVARAKERGIRILGPGSLGVMSPLTGLNATPVPTIAEPGKVAFLTQSGSLGNAVLDWSLDHNAGFSAFAALGQLHDVDWGELIDYFGEDPKTRGILIYLESMLDARSFLSAAREVSLAKPILALTPGSDPLLEAALQRCGILRVERIADLFYMADVLAKQPRPQGARLTIVTNAAGPAQLARDALRAASPADLSEETVRALDQLLPEQWNGQNPVRVSGANAERFAQAAGIAAQDPHSDGLLVILAPSRTLHPAKAADQIRPYAHSLGKPVLASWMGGRAVERGRQILTEAGIPTFPYPDTAARAFEYMWAYAENLRRLYETPVAADGEADRAAAAELIASVQREGRTELEEGEIRRLLRFYGVETEMPFPIYLGIRADARFGPYLLIGLGGRLARLIPGRTPALPPLNSTLARYWIAQTPIAAVLRDEMAADLARLLVRFSMLAAEQRCIREADLEIGAGAFEMRLYPANLAPELLPRLAIRPYPSQYVKPWVMKDGREMVIRPIRPEDEPLLVSFHESLSDQTVYQRYLQLLKLEQRVAHERLTRICFNDYARELALVAVWTDFVTRQERVLAVGRLQRLRRSNEAEVAVVVADAYQGLGLGSELLRRLVEIARLEGITGLWADILAANSRMRRLCESLGFTLSEELGDPTVSGYLELKQ
jgi:acyl-CoA synthetase (NDP forming)/GNAT superfamily N-acetyltransferase